MNRQTLTANRKQPHTMALALLLLGFFTNALSQAEQIAVVETPFLEMKTGPGRGFPVFHVLEQNETFVIHKQHTAWLKVSTTGRRPKSGWIHSSDMNAVATTDGEGVLLPAFDQRQRFARRFGWSINGGDFNGASAISTVLSYRMTNNFTLLTEVGQIFGQSSNANRYGISLRHEPFPSWRLSPYFQLGTGQVDTQPFATLVAAQDRSDQMTSVGGGMKFYLTRQFTVFVDFSQHQVLTSRDTNEEINEWKLGFSVAF